MVGRIVRVSVIAASALIGGVIGALAAFLVTYLIATEVFVMGESAFLLTFVAFPAGFAVGGLVFALGAFWLMQAWSKEGHHRPPSD